MTLQGFSRAVPGQRYSPVSRICTHPSREVWGRNAVSEGSWRVLTLFLARRGFAGEC